MSQELLTGNKGEWSEVYTLLKVLSDKNLYAGDQNINKIANVIYPIISIFRNEAGKEYQYSILDDLVIVINEDIEIKIPIKDFKNNSLILLEKIKNSGASAFSVPEIKEFMDLIKCIAIKSGSKNKADITIKIHDLRTNQQPILGFSIKSQLGGASTLLNAGKTTNFIYAVDHSNIDQEEINRINNISSNAKIKDRLIRLKELGATLSFSQTEQVVFSNNLMLIDSRLPEILSNIIYTYNTTSLNKLSDLVAYITEKNPLNYDLSQGHNYYEYKIKRLLTDVALGMMPKTVWQGHYEANGGYLIVKNDGDIVCYHIYNRNEFENYLLSNTKLDTASSSRHGFGILYKDSDDLFIKLNLQIRFLK